jgi:hypothetical protein
MWRGLVADTNTALGSGSVASLITASGTGPERQYIHVGQAVKPAADW